MKTEAFSLSDIPRAALRSAIRPGFGSTSTERWGTRRRRSGLRRSPVPGAGRCSAWTCRSTASREGRPEPFTPWQVAPELRKLLAWMQAPGWEHISLYATSMGVWFSMLALSEEPLERALFVSPVVDMEQLIRKLMRWAKVTEAQLEREKIIPTELGETLSWDYYSFVREHPIRHWEVPTAILFGERDHLTDLETVEMFARRFGAELEVIPDSRHWFQDPTQLAALAAWTERQLSAC